MLVGLFAHIASLCFGYFLHSSLRARKLNDSNDDDFKEMFLLGQFLYYSKEMFLSSMSHVSACNRSGFFLRIFLSWGIFYRKIVNKLFFGPLKIIQE